jgi:mevalonate pyrophosphate decarboxylase
MKSSIRRVTSMPWRYASIACSQGTEPRGAARSSSSASAITSPIIRKLVLAASQRRPSKRIRIASGGAQPRPRPTRAMVAGRSRMSKACSVARR